MSVQTLFQDVKEFMEIIKSSKTDQVAKWRIKDLNRAIQWGILFENVHTKLTRLAENAQEKFDHKLISVANENGVILENQRKFDISFLSEGVLYIVQSLLQNRLLSEELRKEIFCNETLLKRPVIKQYLKNISANTDLLTTLIEMQNSFLQDPKTCLIPVTGATIVSSVEFLEDLKISFDGNSVIECVMASPNGTDIVLTSIIVAKLSGYSRTIIILLLKWCEKNIYQLVKTTPTTQTTPTAPLLAAVSVQVVEFYDIYIQHLTIITDRCNMHTMMPMFPTQDQSIPLYKGLRLLWESLCQTSLRDRVMALVRIEESCFECTEQTRTSCVWRRLMIDIIK